MSRLASIAIDRWANVTSYVRTCDNPGSATFRRKPWKA